MKAKRSKQGEKSKQARNKPGVCLCACLISATSVATHRLADLLLLLLLFTGIKIISKVTFLARHF